VSKRRIILWRHGRTAWNAERRFQGQSDVPLDEVGVIQAERAAEALARLAPHRIISSDLSRARATAEFLAQLTRLTVHEDSDLRETFAGQWQGLTRGELEDRHGVDLARWAAGSNIRPGGGETRTEVAARMVTAIDRALAEVPAGGTLVVATHGGSARAAIGALLGLPTEHWAALGVLANCAWSVLEESAPPAPWVGDDATVPAWRLQEYNAGSLPVTALADDR
jgi:glucosyl-3-phosphoglycerate phosphatase